MNRRHYLSALTIIAALLSAPAFGQTKDPSKLRVALLPDENATTLIQNAHSSSTWRKHLKKISN